MAAYFGDPGIHPSGGVANLGTGDILNFMDQIREANLNDYIKRKSFDADLAIKSERSRQLFDPANMNSQGTSQPQNVVFKQDMTPYEKAQLGLETQKIGIAKGEAETRAKLGEERVGISEEKNRLEQAKSDQIHQVKMDDMNRKITEANNNLEVARQRLAQHADDTNALRDFHAAQQAAIQARFELTMAQKDKEHQDNVRILQGKLDTANEALKQKERPSSKTTTITNPDGTVQKGTTVTTPGSPDQDIVHITGPVDPKTGKPQQGTMPRGSYSDYWKEKGWIINDNPTINNPDNPQGDDSSK